MKTYTIVPKGNRLDWSAVPTADIDYCQWGYYADVHCKGQLCYDKEAIYVRLCARETDIRAEEKGQTALPYLDSCLEFFFCPEIGNDTYFNIEMNPNCAMYLGIGTNSYDLIRLLLPEGGNFDAKAARTSDGWEISYRIPVSFVQRFFPEFSVYPGKKMRGNFYKCGDEMPQKHYLSWNPIGTERPNFQTPQYFGELYFE